MAIIAVTAGAEHWSEIAMYCKTKQDILKKTYHLELENGTPTDDTFQRIFAIIKPKELYKERRVSPELDLLKENHGIRTG